MWCFRSEYRSGRELFKEKLYGRIVLFLHKLYKISPSSYLFSIFNGEKHNYYTCLRVAQTVYIRKGFNASYVI